MVLGISSYLYFIDANILSFDKLKYFNVNIGVITVIITKSCAGMLEFGLEQSVSLGGQRLVSPTLGVASLDSADNCTGEEFLEVRYHESPPEDSSSILSEVISHMHTFSTASTSEAPESPTIPRDITRDFTGSSSSEFEDVSSLKAQKEAENEQLKVSDIKQSLADSCVLQQQKSSQVHSTTRPDLRLEVHKATSHHLDVSKMSAITMAKLSPTHDDTSGTLLRSLLNKPDCDTNANTVVSSGEWNPLYCFSPPFFAYCIVLY